MPDLFLRQIDDQMTGRIKALARERRCSINDVVLHALRHGLGLTSVHLFTDTPLRASEEFGAADPWDADEKAVFQEAIRALSHAPAQDEPGYPHEVDPLGMGSTAVKSAGEAQSGLE